MKNTVRYEYKVVNEGFPIYRSDPDIEQYERRLLTELGNLSADGWEVVSAIAADRPFRVLLRREVKP